MRGLYPENSILLHPSQLVKAKIANGQQCWITKEDGKWGMVGKGWGHVKIKEGSKETQTEDVERMHN